MNFEIKCIDNKGEVLNGIVEFLSANSYGNYVQWKLYNQDGIVASKARFYYGKTNNVIEIINKIKIDITKYRIGRINLCSSVTIDFK